MNADVALTANAHVRVAFLGPAGTFGEEAAMRFAPGATLVPFPSHSAVASAVESGMARYGVVAIENSLNGSVAETLDILIHESTLQIQRELLLPIEHQLVATPGTNPGDVRIVFGHPQSLGQCRKFLERCFPKAQLAAALSNAEAIEQTLRRGPDSAAIGTLRGAELLGAEVIARGIQDAANNVTRFLLLGRDRQPPTGHDRTSIAFTFASDRPGSLAGVLNVFGGRGINCSKIESRPTREVFGEYVFLIDFDGHAEVPPGCEALAEVRALCEEVKVFGSYPRFEAGAAKRGAGAD